MVILIDAEEYVELMLTPKESLTEDQAVKHLSEGSLEGTGWVNVKGGGIFWSFDPRFERRPEGLNNNNLPRRRQYNLYRNNDEFR